VGNAGLARSQLERYPVRVVAGRAVIQVVTTNRVSYDGLFQVVDYWSESGKDGFRIWRFRLMALRLSTCRCLKRQRWGRLLERRR